jgi:RNA polymerase sigma factor (TIGR02999 family)
MRGQTGSARKESYDAVVELMYSELKRLARVQLRRERADSLHPTRLVNDIYDRLLQYRMPFENREHFLSAAATAMRRVLVERARRVTAQRRGGRTPATTLDESLAGSMPGADPDLVIDVDRAMSVLREDQVRLTELKFFLGLTLEETAGAMGIKAETAKKRWRVIKALLFRELSAAGQIS